VYKQPKDAAVKAHKAAQVKALIDKHRKVLPRVGTRKLHSLMAEELRRKGLKMGRDALFVLLANNDLLIRPKRRYVQTTMSKHWLRKWPNLVKNKQIQGPDEVWVSDITYLKTVEGTMYLNMVTDAFSRCIVGYALADSMETAAMIKAFEMALGQRRSMDKPTIHHSDRGVQYCSKEYVSMSAQHGVLLSMTENGDPYENALAERMNRTIKEEFGMDRTLKSKQQLRALVEESILLYNSKRPHLALKMKTPDQVHKTKIPVT